MMTKVSEFVQGMLDSPNMPSRRPQVDEKFESNIKGLYVIGDLSGAPVVKLAMAQGSDVAEHIASLPDARGNDAAVYDLVVVGAGASGLNCALVAKERGLRVVVLEKEKIANTIENFPEGKWVYAEPDQTVPKGKLWLDGARKEDLIVRWNQIVAENGLDVRTQEGVTGITRRKDGVLEVATAKGSYPTRRVVLATGQRGNPRKLNVPGEDRERVYHRLYSPKHYREEDILVIGGGNSAIEAAITLADQNRVTLSYRGAEFSRVFKDNERLLKEAVEAGRITVILNSNVKKFGQDSYTLEAGGKGAKTSQERPYHHAFVLVGAELPTEFLKSLGIQLENEWNGSPLVSVALLAVALLGMWLYGGSQMAGLLLGLAGLGGLVAHGMRGSRYSWLALSFFICYAVYGIKRGYNHEFWPFTGWGYKSLSWFGRPWSFWYTVLYSVLMTFFGLKAMKRWGLDRKDRFQIWRYVSLLSFQWIFFFIVPEFLFQYAVKYQWVGERLASDPAFAQQAWRSYGIVYAWPLFFHTWLGSPHQIWAVWGVILTFGIIPLLVLFHGKRYCSWICGCGGLAETLGDRWRHLAPKGKESVKWEWMGSVVLGVAALITLMMLTRDMIDLFKKPSIVALDWYGLIVDLWLVGLLPVTLYPFFGGKIWCRYWCPLAKMMHMLGGLYTRLGVSRFAIRANDKCIGCGECSRNCQVGIDVMSFALKQKDITNLTTSCIGCGICVSVCPMDTLSFGAVQQPKLVQIQHAKTPAAPTAV
ncbi:MAG: NAD(P)-binding domain-containing protein [Bryobacteraceae bacterium]|nr:NAD(P)-binding domain-containing protein [Bryobacteraceae bacterium]